MGYPSDFTDKQWELIREFFEGENRGKGVCADAGYRKTFVAAASELGLTVDISERIKPKGWQILPKRWRVERTFSWMNHSRRLSKDYEIRSFSAAAMVIISQYLYFTETFLSTNSKCKYPKIASF